MGQSEKPIQHKNFICATDKEFIDSEDVNIQYLEEAQNLFPFRKKGSLVLPPGFIETVDYTICMDAHF